MHWRLSHGDRGQMPPLDFLRGGNVNIAASKLRFGGREMEMESQDKKFYSPPPPLKFRRGGLVPPITYLAPLTSNRSAAPGVMRCYGEIINDLGVIVHLRNGLNIETN